MADTDTEAFLARQRAEEDRTRAEQDAALEAVRLACDAERKRVAVQATPPSDVYA